VPIHLRGNPGACLAICTKAVRFRFDPFALAEHSYSMWKSIKVGNAWTDVETIAYDSFVIHAIIEAHGKVTGQLKPTYQGEGDDLTCTCTGVLNGEKMSVTSPRLGDIKTRIGRNDQGKLKGSPLWDAKPRQQIWYDVRRDWCRAFQPHILLGWYDKDELMEHGARMNDVTPPQEKITGLAQRLKDAKAQHADRGFDADHVEREASTRSTITDDINQEEDQDGRSNEPDTIGRKSGATGGEVPDRDTGGGDQDDGNAEAVRGEPAGKEVEVAPEPDQKDIFPPDRKPQARKSPPKTRR